ncbi:MAG: nucleotidyltransferase domain-containing protein [Planctomycetes bacterium]|nr:nucleotidyltransferase domain-containing protein [Planctomycetota bacterium]
MDRDRLVEAFRAALAPFSWARFAYLFGSAARGDDRPGSDVDVAVWAAEDPSANDLLTLADALCRAGGRDDVEVVLLSRLGPLFLREVIKDGVLLLERDRDERVVWVARVLSDWYDFEPTHTLWREAFWDAIGRKGARGEAALR